MRRTLKVQHGGPLPDRRTPGVMGSPRLADVSRTSESRSFGRMAKRSDPGPTLFEVPVDLHRFLLVISPAEELSARVTQWKDELSRQIGYFSGRSSVPHITLFFADLPLDRERDVCDGVAAGVKGQRGFVLHYDGITHFPDSRTIYIDPVEKDAIGQVRRSIVDHVCGHRALKKAVNETDHPHLTIAAGLKPAQFATAWTLLAPHELHFEEHVGRVLLLRRSLQPGEKYVPVRSFRLG